MIDNDKIKLNIALVHHLTWNTFFPLQWTVQRVQQLIRTDVKLILKNIFKYI